MYLMHNFYIFVTALFMSLIMVPAIRKWAFDSGAVDLPGERRANNRAIARAGGVAIYIPFLFALLVYFDMTREVRGILAGSLIIFFTGLIDDLYQLNSKQKFIGQVSGSLVAILVGHLYLVELGNLFGLGEIVLPTWLGAVLSLLALVGVINALNLIDGLDGLAGGISVIGLLAFFWLGLKLQDFAVLALSAGMLGGVLGFLRYNAFPAKIFMGDTGSLVVGFVLGCLAIVMTQGEGAKVSAVVPLMILSVPIADTLVVMMRRIIMGRNPFAADRTHLHHRVLGLGLAQSLTVMLIYSLCLFWVLVALFFVDRPDYFLFAGLLLGTVGVHSMVGVLHGQKEKLVVINEIVREKINSTVFSRMLGNVVTIVDVTICLCLGVYALCTFFVAAGETSSAILFGAFGAGLAGLFASCAKKGSGAIVYLLLLVPILLINYEIEKVGGDFLWGILTIGTLTNVVFVIMAFLLALQFVVLKSQDDILDFSLEFILFSLGLILAVVSPEIDEAFYLSGVVSKGIVAVLALKVFSLRSEQRVLWSSLGVNLAMIAVVISWWRM